MPISIFLSSQLSQNRNDKRIGSKNSIAEKVYQNKCSIVVSPQEDAEVIKEYEEYKKESQKLMSFCKKMIDKRDKVEKYEELEQPKGVPDVKPI